MERDKAASATPPTHSLKERLGIARLRAACGHSLHGFGAAYAHEESFRQEARLAVALIPVCLFLPLSGLDKAMMIASVLLVLIVELLNSAIETVIDRISLDRHALSKRAKDIGSAAVCLSLLNAGIVWALILTS
jgi:diacylglycerol kinase (ATP)